MALRHTKIMNTNENKRGEEMPRKLKLRGYFEEYRCGCVSETKRRKRDLLGYCSQHGENRRQIFPDFNP